MVFDAVCWGRKQQKERTNAAPWVKTTARGLWNRPQLWFRIQIPPTNTPDMEAPSMKLTVDSDEPLDRVLQVVGSIYGVRLAIASDETGSTSSPADSRSPSSRSAGR